MGRGTVIALTFPKVRGYSLSRASPPSSDGTHRWRPRRGPGASRGTARGSCGAVAGAGARVARCGSGPGGRAGARWRRPGAGRAACGSRPGTRVDSPGPTRKPIGWGANKAGGRKRPQAGRRRPEGRPGRLPQPAQSGLHHPPHRRAPGRPHPPRGQDRPAPAPPGPPASCPTSTRASGSGEPPPEPPPITRAVPREAPKKFRGHLDMRHPAAAVGNSSGRASTTGRLPGGVEGAAHGVVERAVQRSGWWPQRSGRGGAGRRAGRGRRAWRPSGSGLASVTAAPTRSGSAISRASRISLRRAGWGRLHRRAAGGRP